MVQKGFFHASDDGNDEEAGEGRKNFEEGG